MNFGTFGAMIVIVAPVRGFLPLQAFLLESEKVPKPTRATLLPFIGGSSGPVSSFLIS